MSGETDPTEPTMPQQPLHHALLPKSAMYEGLTGRTNPFWCDIGGARWAFFSRLQLGRVAAAPKRGVLLLMPPVNLVPQLLWYFGADGRRHLQVPRGQRPARRRDADSRMVAHCADVPRYALSVPHPEVLSVSCR